MLDKEEDKRLSEKRASRALLQRQVSHGGDSAASAAAILWFIICLISFLALWMQNRCTNDLSGHHSVAPPNTLFSNRFMYYRQRTHRRDAIDTSTHLSLCPPGDETIAIQIERGDVVIGGSSERSVFNSCHTNGSWQAATYFRRLFELWMNASTSVLDFAHHRICHAQRRSAFLTFAPFTRCSAPSQNSLLNIHVWLAPLTIYNCRLPI